MTTHDAPALASSLPSPDGLSLRPFRALRYADSATERLAARLCPPYDVIGDDERSRLERADPYNAVHLILPRPAARGPGSEPGPVTGSSPYDAARRLLQDWRGTGVLARDEAEGVYVYEIASAGGTTRGLIGALALAAPDAGIVLPHEDTMPGPVTDRLALTEATECNLEPIFCVYDGTEATGQILDSVQARPPLAEASAPDGTRHRLWSITDQRRLLRIARELHPLRALIADGHHRYATYLQYQRDQHARGLGPGPWDFGLAFLVDARRYGPSVEPIHRVVPGLGMERAVQGARKGFRVQELRGPLQQAQQQLKESDAPAFLLTDGAGWLLLTEPDPAGLQKAIPRGHSEAWRMLDVTVAHRYLINTLWGIADSAETVDFEHDAAEAVGRACEAHGVCLLLNPTPVTQVAQVAADGERMPLKSTLFLPKPRSGMLFRPLR